MDIKGVIEILGLKDYMTVIWNRRLLIISVFILFIFAGSLYGFKAVRPLYSSSTIISLGSFNGNLFNDGNVAKAIIVSDDFINKVLTETGIDRKNLLVNDNIKVEIIKDTKFIKVTVYNVNPEISTKIAFGIGSLVVRQGQMNFEKHRNILNKQISINKEKIDGYNLEISRAKKALNDVDIAGITSFERDLWVFRLLDYLRYFEEKAAGLEERNLSLEKELNSVKNLEIIKTADNPAIIVKSNRIEMIIFASGIVGLLFAVLLAFYLEFVKAARRKQGQ